jgi:hypothetical protein
MELPEAAMELIGSCHGLYWELPWTYHGAARSCHGAIIEVGATCGAARSCHGLLEAAMDLPWSCQKLPWSLLEAAMGYWELP